LIIVALFSVLPLIPMFAQQVLLGFPDFHSLTQYSESEISWPSGQRIGGVLLAVFLYGPVYLTHYWFELSLPLNYALFAALVTSLVFTLLGLSRIVKQKPQKRILITTLLITLLGQTFFIVLLRPITPFWMVFAHWPLLAALCALGLDNLYTSGNRNRILAGLTLLLWFSWSIAGFAYIGRAPHDVFFDVPAPGKQGLIKISDIGLFGEGKRATVGRLPVSQWLLIGQPLCQPTTLYGHYALFVDSSFGIGAMRYCRKTQQIVLGGPLNTATAWIGMRDYAWNQAGVVPEQWLGSLGIVTPEKVWSTSDPLPIGDPALPKGLIRNNEDSPKEFAVHAEIPPNQALLIAKRWGTLELRKATANDQEVPAAYQDIFGFSLFKTPSVLATDEKIHWTFVLYGDPRYIDVVSFKASESE
jgi:hypothetical protein